MKATASPPISASQPAPPRAWAPSSAKLNPPSSGPKAIRSPRASAAISRSSAVCILVGRRQLLGVLQRQRLAVERERALAGLAAERLQPRFFVDIALAELGAARVRLGRR